MTVQDSPSLSTVTSFDWSSWNRPRTTHMACIVRFSSWNANAEVFSSPRIHSGVSSLASGAFPFGGIVNFMSFIICLRREKRGQFLMFLIPVIITANLRMALEGGTPLVDTKIFSRANSAAHELLSATGLQQRGRALEAADHGARGGGGDNQRRADLGLWEQIFYGEFDGRRRKRVLVKIIGEGSTPTCKSVACLRWASWHFCIMMDKGFIGSDTPVLPILTHQPA